MWREETEWIWKKLCIFLDVSKRYKNRDLSRRATPTSALKKRICRIKKTYTMQIGSIEASKRTNKF